MNTAVRRISLANVANLEEAIQNLCVNMSVGGFRLVSSCVYGNELLMIFQK